MCDIDPAERVQELTRRYGHLDGEALLRPFIAGEFPGRIALVSSFGSEAAVLLHMAAEIDRRLPVIFLDTRELFGETLRYRDELARRLNLGDLRIVKPEAADLAAGDPDSLLSHRDPDACCGLRKVVPLRKGLAGF